MKKNKFLLCLVSLFAISISSCSFSLSDLFKRSSEENIESIPESAPIEESSNSSGQAMESKQSSEYVAPSSNITPVSSEQPRPSSQNPGPVSSSSAPKPSSEAPKPSSSIQQSSEAPKPSSSAIESSQVPTPSSVVNSSSIEQSSVAPVSYPPEESGFYDISEFSSNIEIHTAAQKAYLSYQGDYSKIPTDQYPDGNAMNSDSLPVPVSWNYRVPSGKTISKYSVIFGQNSDLSDGYEVSNGTNKSVNLYNPYLGRNYYKIVATFTDNSKDETSIRSFDVDTTAPRNLAIGGMTNCRDMGGRVLEDGGKMKQGLIYRTSGYKFDYSTTITEDGKKEMLEHLKVKTEVNVADGTSYNLKLTGTTVKDFKMDYSGGKHHFSRNTESVKNFFNLLGDSSNYPVFFHCRIGTDRTGLCAILLYGLLGVPLNEIYQDYLFSNFGKIGEKRYIGDKAGVDNIQNYINEINSLSGKTFKNKVYNALLAIGVTRNTLDTIISNLTDGTLAKDNDAEQVVATADKLTATGSPLVNDTSDRDHPNYYYTLNNSSKSVSYTFNASKSYKGQAVVYMGNGDASTSKKIGDAISLSFNNNNVAIRDVTYADAGMGKCGSRTNYYPVTLGNVNVYAGSNTIRITGTSNSMNIATICIFDAVTAGEESGGEQGGEQGEHTNHYYIAQPPVTNKAGKQVTTYLCDCGKKYIAIDFLDSYSSLSGNLSDGTTGKLTNGTVVKYDIPAKAGSVQLQFALKMSSSSHSSQLFDPSKYTIKVNGVTQNIVITNGTSYSNVGLTTSFNYITFCEFDIENDVNVEIELDHNNSSYRLLFGEQVRLMYV